MWSKKGSSNKTDLYYAHGINDYAGAFCQHIRPYLDQGYRVILPDLPSHGRSSGLHVHLANADELSRTLHLVMKDVVRMDKENGRKQRQTFIAGSSVGRRGLCHARGLTDTPWADGWMDHCFVLPVSKGQSTSSIDHAHFGSRRYTTGGSESIRDNPPIAGAILMCPMLGIQSDSRPSHLVELAARALSSFAGRLPFAQANKGKNTEDPSIETKIEQDPQTYNDKLRIATGLALLQGLQSVTPRFEEFKLPILLCHGVRSSCAEVSRTRTSPADVHVLSGRPVTE